MQHHARLRLAPSVAAAELPKECYTDSADVTRVDVTVLRIDEVRHIKAVAYQTPVSGTYRTIIIAAQEITHAAQNALLKILEEPPTTTQFWVVVPTASALLPTVRSRLQLEPGELRQVADEAKKTTDDFLSSGYRERLELIQKWHKQLETSELRSWLQRLVREIQYSAHIDSPALPAVSLVVSNMERAGNSPKLLLEYLALYLPVK